MRNVVQVLEYGSIGDIAVIVMECLDGKDLARALGERLRIGLDETRRIVQQVASALDYAHARGLVHRDIKPSNIMLLPDRAVLMDFGIAKVFDATVMTRTGNILGTFEYMPPEQIQGADTLDGRADVYALGAMTYQMLVGKVPFAQGNPGALLMAHITHPPPDASAAVPSVPRQTARAIQKAMAKDPAARFLGWHLRKRALTRVVDGSLTWPWT